jgi:hypothetical protein
VRIYDYTFITSSPRDILPKTGKLPGQVTALIHLCWKNDASKDYVNGWQARPLNKYPSSFLVAQSPLVDMQGAAQSVANTESFFCESCILWLLWTSLAVRNADNRMPEPGFLSVVCLCIRQTLFIHGFFTVYPRLPIIEVHFLWGIERRHRPEMISPINRSLSMSS